MIPLVQCNVMYERYHFFGSPCNYFAPGRGVNYCDQRVCVSVCLSVCLLSYLKNHTSNFRQIFSTCYLWPWLGPPLIAVRYVM